MYAIIETGGKQYRVSEGDEIYIEKLDVKGELYAEGAEVVFDKVVAVGGENVDIKIGTPYVDGAKVTAELVKNGRAKKLVVFTYKSKKSSKTKKGHRQAYSKVKITKIS